jgi:hypothetical protein
MATETGSSQQAMAHIYRVLDRSRLAWRVVESLDGLLKAFAIVGGSLIVGFLADNFFHLPGPVRLVCALVVLAGLALMLARFVFYPLLSPMSDEMVAAHVERAFPGLDNSVINSVLLAGEKFRDPLTRRMAVSQILETAERVQTQEVRLRTGARGLWRSGRWALALLAAGLLYGVLFSSYFGNALLRFVHPTRYIPPITATRLEVSPGDTSLLQGASLAVEARVSGLLPENGRIFARSPSGERSSDSMAFEGNAFTYGFANVQHDFTYRVEAGDAATPWYRVTVRNRPAVRSLDITYSYPAYTGVPDRTDAGASGDIRALVGTSVRLRVQTDRPVRVGGIELRPSAGPNEPTPAPESFALVPEADAILRGEFTVTRSGRYLIGVADEAGVANSPQVRRIEAVPDAPPRVSFEQPARDVAVAPDAKVALLAGAEDDFSLRELHLFVQRRAGADWEILQSWTYGPGAHAAREGCVLDVRELGLKPGGALAYYMQASDGLRREGADREGAEVGRSRTYYVRIVDAAAAATAAEDTREALRDVIRKLLELQKANLSNTRSLADRALGSAELSQQEGGAWTDFRDRASALQKAEEEIYARAGDAATAYAGQDSGSVTEALARVAAGPMSRAVDLLKDLRAAPDAESIQPRSQAAAETEAAIISLLQQLLDNPAALLAQMLREEEASEKVAEQPEEAPEAKQLAEKLLKALDDFAKDQNRVVEMSNQLAQKPVDDFTDEDEKKLQDIVETEKKWTKFFQEAATDLSKLPPQDMSLATQAKEVLEVYSEMQQAAEEAERKAVEMAVPHEQAGLELAKSIETNIEKWLMETKDNQLWSMEDPLQDYEVPIAELPKELQDLIGDLVENEEDMQQQFDDTTSGWFDSLDLGAGWDTMDGPISNMSAKGVTGNRLPNTQEIGGRSGEGRTGKSSGQFVEEEATGKGGRQTPTRLTPDPFEAGWVKDTSAEAPTGATGGGKVSGQGAEGFQGPVPPPLQQRLKRMAVQQGELIDKAKRLDYGLQKYQHPRGKLPETIDLMEKQKAGLEQAELSTFGKTQRIVLDNLREVKELSEKQKQLYRDRSALLPKQLRDEIASSQNEKVPEQYRQMVENYFRALSEAGTPRK